MPFVAGGARRWRCWRSCSASATATVSAMVFGLLATRGPGRAPVGDAEPRVPAALRGRDHRAGGRGRRRRRSAARPGRSSSAARSSCSARSPIAVASPRRRAHGRQATAARELPEAGGLSRVAAARRRRRRSEQRRPGWRRPGRAPRGPRRTGTRSPGRPAELRVRARRSRRTEPPGRRSIRSRRGSRPGAASGVEVEVAAIALVRCRRSHLDRDRLIPEDDVLVDAFAAGDRDGADQCRHDQSPGALARSRLRRRPRCRR